MPRGMYKSRTMRRVFVKTPGANVKLHYRKRKPMKAKCARCGAALAGVPRERPYKVQRLTKAQKRPNRPFGGNLCAKCVRLEIIRRNR